MIRRSLPVPACTRPDCLLTHFTDTPCQLGKLRPGDQALPTLNDSPAIQPMVIRDLEVRMELGIQRYGTLLQANNGRDMLQDLYEELLDAAVYLKGLIIERDSNGPSAN